MSGSKQLREVAETVEEKNGDYGNAIEKAAAIKRVLADEDGPATFYTDGDRVWTGDDKSNAPDYAVEAVMLADTPTLTTAHQETVDGIMMRLLDKVCRIYHLVFIKDDRDVDDETTVDSAKDLAGYAGRLAAVLKR